MSDLVVLTRSQLDALLDAAIDRAKAVTHDEWMTADDVAKMLDVQRASIPHVVKHQGLPCYRPGKGYTFRRSEVIAWLEARRVRARSPRLRALKGGP